MDWQSIAKAKREAIDKAVDARLPPGVEIPTTEAQRDGLVAIRQLLTPEAHEITERALEGGITPLLASLAAGKLQAVKLVEAFVQRAALAHKLTNCLSEVVFDAAIERAKQLDEEFQRTGKPVGPLHGLPISLKDQFRVQGTATSVGYVGWLNHIETSDEESLLVKDLTALGAVILCKTNVPTSTLCMETDNNIIGWTTSARNRLVSSGGSSGGEGALVGLGGSMIGLGTDIGGSVRFPATANGICSLRPSHGRLSYMGLANCFIGQEVVLSVVGPMGRRLDDIELLASTLINREAWLRDPQILPIPWRREAAEEVQRLAAQKQLTFGLFQDDGVGALAPPVARVLRETAERVRAAGHKVIDWKPPSHAESFAWTYEWLVHDGGVDVHKQAALSGEPLIPQLQTFFGAEPGNTPKTIHEVWDLTNRRDKFRERYLQYWNSTASETGTGRPVDFVILPVMPTPSYEKGKGMHVGYTSVANILDYASVVINAGKVLASDEKVARDSYYSDIDKAMWEQYDPKLFENTPIGIQILGRRLEEERVIAGAREVQRCISDAK